MIKFYSFINMWKAYAFVLIFSLKIFNVFAQTTTNRIDCHPDRYPQVTQANCAQRNCLWDPNVDDVVHTPQCYFPSNTGYIVSNVQGNNISLTKSAASVNNPFGSDFPLDFTYNSIGSGINLLITPSGGMPRYQPIIDINHSPQISSAEKLSFRYTNDSIFSFQVYRERTNVSIWDTSIGGLLFADQYIQIATYIPTTNVYGLGENSHPTLKRDFSKYITWGMWARDQPPDNIHFNTMNLYGVHAFYVGIESDGTAHGVFIFNGNAQEITVAPAPHLIYRTVGGNLEIFFFPGPKPEDVIQQYLQVIGTPFLPAYFNLGFQISHAYPSFVHLTEVVNRTLAAGVPVDTFYVDNDYMIDGQSFTLIDSWVQLPNYTIWLHEHNLHLTLNNNPFVRADSDALRRGLAANASFFEWPSFDQVPPVNTNYSLTNGTKLMLGKVWPSLHVVWPDYTDPITRDWWASEFAAFHKIVPFDQIWLDMNEPSAMNVYPIGENMDVYLSLHCPITGNESHWDNPPYWTVNAYQFGNDTLCMSAVTRNGYRNYDIKNLFGWGETIAAKNGIQQARGTRSSVIPRSTFASSGRYGGHWTGDTTSTWEFLRGAIIAVLEFNLFGIPHTGSDICGFYHNATADLCLRWHQVGAFHSFSRNHDKNIAADQDPGVWPSVALAARIAFLFRYRHLPYLFSLHFVASLYGGSVTRPLFFEFPSDPATYNISYQFLWGQALLIVPVVTEGALSVDAYLPVNTTWYSVYEYFYGTKMKTGWQNFPAPWDYLLPVFIRGGYIVPRQRPSVTTIDSRKNEFQIVIALDTDKNQNLYANGELYWDDGESIIPDDDLSKHNYFHFLYNFNLNQQLANLSITCTRAATNLTLTTLDNIEIFGYAYQPNLNSAKLNGQPITIDTTKSSYSPFTNVLNITTKNFIDLNTNGPNWILTWQNN